MLFSSHKAIAGLGGIVLFLWPVFAMGQSDSSSFLKSIMLKEVLIQGPATNKQIKNKKPEVDMQTATKQLLSHINGVEMIRRGNFAWEPTIRGLNAGQINVTIGGMAIFGACTDRMDPVSSYIEPNNLNSIKVSYGPSGFSNGSTIGGGINFKIKKPVLNRPETWSGMAGLGYETNGEEWQTLASLSYSEKKFAMNMNGIFRSSNDYRAGGGEIVQFSQYHKWNGGLAAKYELNNNHYLTANYIHDEGYDIGYPGLTMDVAYARANIASLSHVYISPSQSHLERWETKIYFNHINHAMDDTKRPKSQVPMHMDMPGTSRTMGFYSETQWNFSNKHYIKARLSGYENRLHAEMTMHPKQGTEMFMLTWPDLQRLSLGLNLADHYRVGGHGSFIYGLQFNEVHSSIFTKEGKQTLSGIYSGDPTKSRLLYNAFINPSYSFNRHWAIHAQMARSMRSPSLKELYSFYIFDRLDNYDYIGNPDLKTEKSWNFSLSGQFQKGIFQMSLQAYSYFFTNYIVGVIEGNYQAMTGHAEGVKQYNNLASARLLGMESTLTVQPMEGFKFISRNTYEKGTDGVGRALPRISPFQSVNEIHYRLKKYHFSLKGRFAAAQKHINTPFYGETSTPSFSIFNIKAGRLFNISSNQLSVDVAIENLFDTHYYDHLDVMEVPRLGRNFIFHATWHF